MGTPTDDYILGRTSAEYQRLRTQAKVWEEATKRVLLKAGLHTGMSCLDIGCGPGEVMRLMGEVVGPEGSVTGVDVDGDIGREALDVLRSTASGQYAFHEMDVESSDQVPGSPFDVAFARITLFHLKEPVAFLRKMMKWTKPGGIIVVQEYDFESWEAYPKLDEMSEAIQTFRTVAERVGHDARLGFKLPTYFIEAGLGAPDGTDVAALLYEIAVGDLTQAVYNSIFPMAQRLGIADEASRQRILGAIDEAIQAGGFFGLSPLLIGVWKCRSL
ncbi:MAG: methyltransferase domain-containing protein [Anaerolineales bacterium]|jgi:ubiquinone/menaquinone biosynthesis C-methylase UbiE